MAITLQKKIQRKEVMGILWKYPGEKSNRYTHIYGQFYLVVVHTVLLYGSDIWVLTIPKPPVFGVVCFWV